MAERYRVEVTKDHLVFSAGHFITFNGNQCERLHGHNYRFAVEIDGPLDENDYVVDFIFVRDAATKIAGLLDHHMLLPTESKLIQTTVVDGEVDVRFQNKRWLFPAEDCVLLPIANTTTELLARWIGQAMQQAFAEGGLPLPRRIAIRLEENFGQWAIWESTAT